MNKTNTFFGTLISCMVVCLLSTNFDTVQSVYGEAEPTVFSEESESNLPPLPTEELEEETLPPVPSEELDENYGESIVVKEEPVLIKEENKTKRRRIFGGTSRAAQSYGLRIFRRNR